MTARRRRDAPSRVVTRPAHVTATGCHVRRMTRESCRPSTEHDRSRRPGHLAPQQMARLRGYAGTPQLTDREPIVVHRHCRQDSRAPRRVRATASRVRAPSRSRTPQPQPPPHPPGNDALRAEWPPRQRRRQARALTLPRPFERPRPPVQCTEGTRRDERPRVRAPLSSAPGRHMPPGPRVPGTRGCVDQPSRLDRRTGPRNLSTSARSSGDSAIEGCPMRLATSRGFKSGVRERET